MTPDQQIIQNLTDKVNRLTVEVTTLKEILQMKDKALKLTQNYVRECQYQMEEFQTTIASLRGRL